MAGDSPRVRLGVLGIVVISLFVALLSRAYYLQVLAAPQYEQAAERNRTEVVPISPLRGRILDRNGIVLADNRLSTVVNVRRDAIRSSRTRAALFEKIAPVLGTTPDVLQQRWGDARYEPLLPLPLAEDVPVEVAMRIEEQGDQYPGVTVDDVPVRVYPYGSLAAHVVGYTGKLPESEAKSRLSEGYQLGDRIGITGIERMFEGELRGTPGKETLEVDAQRRVLRVLDRQEPVPGHDVQLTLDLQVQQVAEQTLEQGLEEARTRKPREGGPNYAAPAGAVVATDPTNGAVIAMASYPAFDPQQFSDGISQKDYDALTADGNANPLVNRAIEGSYLPGSTFKLITAMAGATSGVITPYVPITDNGTYTVPGCKGEQCTFRNSGGIGNGRVDLPEALAASSDVYFYGVGADLWRLREERGWQLPLQEMAQRFGLGTPSGIALPGERAGRIPTPALKEQMHEEAPVAFPYGQWFTGDNVLTAIGQGDVLVTPLQLVDAYATFANGGTVYQPNVVWRVLEAGTYDAADPAKAVVVREIGPRPSGQVDLGAARDPILQGLVGATTGDRGTARAAFAGSDVTVAGKTGTAQTGNKEANKETSLFVGFAPAYQPKYAVSVVMEQSGFGATAAAPVARAVFDALDGAIPMPRVVPVDQRVDLDLDLSVDSNVQD